MEEQDVYGYEFEGTRYDAGTTMGWLKASVELALQRPDLATEFRAYLAGPPASEPERTTAGAVRCRKTCRADRPARSVMR